MLSLVSRHSTRKNKNWVQGFQVHTENRKSTGNCIYPGSLSNPTRPFSDSICINESNLLNFLQKSMSEVGTLFQLPQCDTGVFLGQVHTVLTWFHRKMISLLWTLWFTMKVKFCRWIKVKTAHKCINHGTRPSNSATCAHAGKESAPTWISCGYWLITWYLWSHMLWLEAFLFKHFNFRGLVHYLQKLFWNRPNLKG